ncbi:death effector domain-containing 1 isoform X2 [Gouania willdenowi]|uniref:DNA-binding death effector domain-containing protein 2-like n=1 Tax=Gouania willdenowi TaxID=441366 RepID=A0A8C5EKH7_GOUWI|nr:DNA-binding death effector domain-containing protein 2-like isoform X2 [Gouania willdenowi]
MAALHHQWNPLREFYWDETECLNYYGMLSLHEIFEVIGSHLTETDIEVLSFLLNETCTAPHPLDPAGWTVEPHDDDVGDAPSQELLKVWRRLQPQASHIRLMDCKPRSGLELLLGLERKGYISDGNLEPLLQLLRVLTRHDLLTMVSHKKRRTVSPERIGQCYETERRDACGSGMGRSCRQTPPSFTQQLRSGIYSPTTEPSTRRRRKKRGNGWSRKPKKTTKRGPLPCLTSASSQKVSCDIRLRVRADYLEHESVLRNEVSSNKQQPLERQFELFSRANSVLRTRDLGSIICDIKFTELDNLEAFWGDYLSGALLEALKGVFITDSLTRAAGSERVRLLISVDQDDYEEGRRLLRARKVSSSNGGLKATR